MTVMHSARSSLYFRQELFPVRQRSVHARSSRSWKAKRGVYGGALGYLDFTGNMDTCIAIRMAVKKDGRVYVQAGGGIVADSIPENEYQESANKAAAVMNAIKAAKEVLE